MRLTIYAVGRLKTGPELTLVDDYIARATQVGRPLALGPCAVTEIDERKVRGRGEEGARLITALADGAIAIGLDERGKTLTSPAFAGLLSELRDRGVPEAAFLIGGADGHGPELRSRADRLLSFGPMVWPHMLARVMLAEQIYRAVSILAGGPYHRS